MKTLVCKNCQLDLSIESSFYKRKTKVSERVLQPCKTCMSLKQKQYYQNNKKNVLKRAAEYRADNREIIRIKDEEYRPKRKAKTAQYLKNRRDTDPQYRLLVNTRNRIGIALKRNSKTTSSLELLGCSITELSNSLETQFSRNMSWDNQGDYWHVDHIIPCDYYDLSIIENQYKCFNYRNLRPLRKLDNIKKSNKVNMDLVKKYNIKDLL